MFTDDDKRVFSFDRNDGQGQAWGDPLALLRGLNRELGDHVRVVNQSNGHFPEGTVDLTADQRQRLQAEAGDQVVAAVRVAFGLGAFDPSTGAGCTDVMVLKVLDAFLDWLEKKSAPGTTSPPSSAPASLPSPSTGSTMAASSDCGCDATN